MSLRPGEIVLEGATRSFSLRHEHSRTLKELFIRGGHAKRTIVTALERVDLHVEPGEAVGLVGRNGAGKTSTLRCLAGIVPLDSGRAECGGRTVSLLELGAGFGEEFSGRENIYLNGALHGFGRNEMEERIGAIVAFSELGEFIHAPVKAYSAGMQLRLGFSIVAHLDADVMLIDEILAVGDESFQRKCLARVSERMEAGATLVLVSHDPMAIERVCRRLVVFDGGEVAYDGSVPEGLLFYHRLLGTTEGASRSVRPEDRHASLEIAELELQDEQDRRRQMFRTGEQVTVALAVQCREPAERAVAALEVRDAHGTLCFRTDTALGRVDGRVEVRFAVERLSLLGGDYDLAVGVFDQDAPGVGVLDRIAHFSVAQTPDGQGVADLRGSWTVTGRTGEAVSR